MNWLILTGLLVLGDSMSAPECSWARQLDQQAGIHIQIDAMPGRAITDYVLSPDLEPWGTMDSVVIWMGANDVRLGYSEQLFDNAQSLVTDLHERGFTVVFALPPLINLPDWDTTQARTDLLQLKHAVTVDPPAVATIDGIHPTCDGNYQLAVWWMWTLFQQGITQ